MKRFFLCLIILQMAYWSAAPAQDDQPLPHLKVPAEEVGLDEVTHVIVRTLGAPRW